MKHLRPIFIAPVKLVLEHKDKFKEGAHHHQLDESSVGVFTCDFVSAAAEQEWRALPEVHSLPDVLEPSKTISDKHQAHLAGYGVDIRFNAHQVRKAIRKIQPDF